MESNGKSHMLSDKQLQQFFEEGFLVIKDFFKMDELQPLIDDINRLVDNLVEDLYNAGM